MFCKDHQVTFPATCCAQEDRPVAHTRFFNTKVISSYIERLARGDGVYKTWVKKYFESNGAGKLDG